MAENAKAYSFYIPAGDESLAGFIDAQSNLSMSIRLVLKAFAENYADRYPDAATMDLKELVRNMDIGAEKLAEIAATEKAAAAKQEDNGKTAEKAPEPAPEAEQDPGYGKSGPDEAAEGIGDAAEPENGGADDEDEGENDEIIVIDDGEDEPENEAEEAGAEDDPGSFLGGPEGDEAEPEIARLPDPEPESKPDPEPKRKPAEKKESEARKDMRKAYNDQQFSAEATSLDEIERMMGEF